MALVGDSYEYYDKKFYDLTVPIAEVEELYNGNRWAEGPVWFNDGGYLIWSDIPNNRMLRWVPDLGVGVFRVHPLIMTLGTGLIAFGGVQVYQRTVISTGFDVPPWLEWIGTGTTNIPFDPAFTLIIPNSVHSAPAAAGPSSARRVAFTTAISSVFASRFGPPSNGSIRSRYLNPSRSSIVRAGSVSGPTSPITLRASGGSSVK